MRSALVSEKRKDGCTMLNEYIKKSLVKRNDFDITISQTTYYLYSMNIVIMSYFSGCRYIIFLALKCCFGGLFHIALTISALPIFRIVVTPSSKVQHNLMLSPKNFVR